MRKTAKNSTFEEYRKACPLFHDLDYINKSEAGYCLKANTYCLKQEPRRCHRIVHWRKINKIEKL